MFLSSSGRIFNVEDEPLLPFIRRSFIRLALILAASSLIFAADPVKPTYKKKVVHPAGTTAAKRPVTAKAPVKSAAVPHVITKAVAKNAAASTQASATNRAIVARVAAGKRPAARSAWKAPNYADSLEGDNVDGEDLLVRRAAVDALGP